MLKMFHNEESVSWKRVERVAVADFDTASERANLRFRGVNSTATALQNVQVGILANVAAAKASAAASVNLGANLQAQANVAKATAAAIQGPTAIVVLDSTTKFPTLNNPVVKPPVKPSNITCAADTCENCAGMLGCGWCLTNSKCEFGNYEGPNEKRNCPRATPPNFNDPLASGVQQNWFFNPLMCPPGEKPVQYVSTGTAEIPEHCLNGEFDVKTEQGTDCGGECQNGCHYGGSNDQEDQEAPENKKGALGAAPSGGLHSENGNKSRGGTKEEIEERAEIRAKRSRSDHRRGSGNGSGRPEDVAKDTRQASLRFAKAKAAMGTAAGNKHKALRRPHHAHHAHPRRHK